MLIALLLACVRQCVLSNVLALRQDDGNGTLYASSKRVPCFSGGLPINQTIGMKFTITTIPPPNASIGHGVELRLYLDETNNGIWELKHEFVDYKDLWFSNNPTKAAIVLAGCNHTDGDVGLEAGNVCFFRADGGDETTQKWQNAYILNENTYCSENDSVCMFDMECCSGICVKDPAFPTDAGTCMGSSATSSEPSAAPTPGPTSSPVAAPTMSPVSCTLAGLGDSCFRGSDCCSGTCSGGKRANRVCLP